MCQQCKQFAVYAFSVSKLTVESKLISNKNNRDQSDRYQHLVTKSTFTPKYRDQNGVFTSTKFKDLSKMLYPTIGVCLWVSNRNPRAIRTHESIGTNLGSWARQTGVCHVITLRRRPLLGIRYVVYYRQESYKFYSFRN